MWWLCISMYSHHYMINSLLVWKTKILRRFFLVGGIYRKSSVPNMFHVPKKTRERIEPVRIFLYVFSPFVVNSLKVCSYSGVLISQFFVDAVLTQSHMLFVVVGRTSDSTLRPSRVTCRVSSEEYRLPIPVVTSWVPLLRYNTESFLEPGKHNRHGCGLWLVYYFINICVTDKNKIHSDCDDCVCVIVCVCLCVCVSPEVWKGREGERQREKRKKQKSIVFLWLRINPHNGLFSQSCRCFVRW